MNAQKAAVSTAHASRPAAPVRHEIRVAPSDDLGGPWRQYALNHPHGTLFHMPAWSQAVRQAYRHQPMHLLAWDGGRLVGGLPLFLVKSRLAGKLLVSIPYSTYGGILADDDVAAGLLLDRARGLLAETGARCLELRHRHDSGLPLPTIDRYDTFRAELPDDPEQVLPSLPRKARAAARNAIRDCGADAVAIGPAWLDAIYDLYAFTLRRLGSPNYSRRLFHALAEAFGEDCVCLVVRNEGQPVAGVVSFVFRDELVAYFSGSLPQAQRLNANNLMYTRLMAHAIERGCRVFDFNRTRRDNAGPYNFKRHHGFEPEPLHYQMCPAEGCELPNLSPSNRKYQLAGRVWCKLPLWATRPLGARISRWIP